jgi:hypothetical protein
VTKWAAIGQLFAAVSIYFTETSHWTSGPISNLKSHSVSRKQKYCTHNYLHMHRMWGGALERSARRENWEKARTETEQSEKALSPSAPPLCSRARSSYQGQEQEDWRRKKPGMIC